jgi:hypothetical protein
MTGGVPRSPNARDLGHPQQHFRWASIPSGAKALVSIGALTARLKSCPFKAAAVDYSDACKDTA